MTSLWKAITQMHNVGNWEVELTNKKERKMEGATQSVFWGWLEVG